MWAGYAIKRRNIVERSSEISGASPKRFDPDMHHRGDQQKKRNPLHGSRGSPTSRGSVKAATMDFPPYIPQRVREYVIQLLFDGDDDMSSWTVSLPLLEAILSRININLQPNCSDWPQRIKAYCEWMFASTTRDMDCVRRLIRDPRMREAWATLCVIVADEDEYVAFFESAWLAALDFGDLRKRAREANEAAASVAKAARDLVDALRRFDDVGLFGPGTIFDMRELLRLTSSKQGGDFDAVWQDLRNYITGDDWCADKPLENAYLLVDSITGEPITDDGGKVLCIDADQIFSQEAKLVWKELDPKAGLPSVDVNAYTWTIAPTLEQCLLTCAENAYRFTAHYSDSHVAAALASQKPSPKYEYIRAFADLISGYGLTVDAAMMRAMVPTVAVALGLGADDDVNLDDVRNALR